MLELEEELKRDRPTKAAVPSAQEEHLKQEIDIQKAQIVKLREATLEQADLQNYLEGENFKLRLQLDQQRKDAVYSGLGRKYAQEKLIQGEQALEPSSER